MDTARPIPDMAPRPLGRAQRDENWVFHLFLWPGVIFLGVMSLIPLVATIYLSLQRLNLNLPDQEGFAGLENFRRMAADPYLWHSLVVTLVLILLPVALQMVLGLGLALLLNHESRTARLTRSLFVAPLVIAPVVCGILWKVLLIPNLNGLNYFLGLVGIPGPNWLDSSGWAIAAVTMVGVWQNTPFVTLLLLAGLQSLPQDPFEAARVDGAGRIQTFWHVTLPLLTPPATVALLFRLIGSLELFPIIYVLTGGGPGRATEMLNYYAYTHGFQYLDIGYASALVLVLLVVVTAISVPAVRVRLRSMEG